MEWSEREALRESYVKRRKGETECGFGIGQSDSYTCNERKVRVPDVVVARMQDGVFVFAVSPVSLPS